MSQAADEDPGRTPVGGAVVVVEGISSWTEEHYFEAVVGLIKSGDIRGRGGVCRFDGS